MLEESINEASCIFRSDLIMITMHSVFYKLSPALDVLPGVEKGLHALPIS